MRRKVQKTNPKTAKHNPGSKICLLPIADKVTLSRILMSAYKFGQTTELKKFLRK